MLILSSVAKSILFKITISAYLICLKAASLSKCLASKPAASTTVMIASRRVKKFNSVLIKVIIMGNGSANPVVSMTK